MSERRGSLGAAELAELLGLSRPTQEQAAAIEAPLGPAVVIAGAGSGKTETMASRVVWLVAGGLVAPDRVLGLTFTRKAAAELAIRIRSRLALWRRRADPRRADPALDGEPTVLTYAAYASRLVGEHALRVGAEPDALVLSEARRWQIADEAVRRYDGALPETVGRPDRATHRVLQLAGELAEHLLAPSDVEALTTELMSLLESLPPGSNRVSNRWPWDIGSLVSSLADRRSLLPLVRRFIDAKRRSGRGGMDFGDQMALAARLAELPEVRQLERARHAAVLLDEYQDTGHAQAQMLHGLFGDGHPVTAVGDPFQAIYGWRGAGSGAMDRFATRFRRADGAPAPVLTLSTSFRNAISILRAANDLAGPLAVSSPDAEPLRPREHAPAGDVRIAYVLTVADEASWIADRIAAEWRARAPGGPTAGGAPGAAEPAGPRTAAVLVRRRAQIPLLEQALVSAGLPVEVVGLGGLLSTPEVTEVVATLRVLQDHGAGASLMRLLTGPRWRIGPADLAALGERARALAHAEPGAGPEDAVGLVEALDDLGPPERYSPAGYARMAALARELAGLRRRSGIGLADLVLEVERQIGVGAEVAARPDRARTARAHLDRFLDEVAAFAEEADLSFAAGSGGPPGLGALLAYLAAVEREEYGGAAGEVEVAPERVQILTVHGAKGLEWDVVAVAGLVNKTFPAQARDADWARVSHKVPNPLRGDAADLPQLDLSGVRSLQDVKDRMRHYQAAVADRHALEERRLAYVAMTRARQALFLAGAAWAGGSQPREPADFLVRLRELAEDGRASDVGDQQASAVRVARWVEDPGEENPLLREPISAAWPFDPLGARRAAIEDGAELVRQAMQAPAPVEHSAPSGRAAP
ncbi:MAG: ATP-dependent helicase, partial [Frankiaceae bacterium]|nr:ATP-dependent helicase [Frankiaceae bacterium]